MRLSREWWFGEREEGVRVRLVGDGEAGGEEAAGVGELVVAGDLGGVLGEEDAWCGGEECVDDALGPVGVVVVFAFLEGGDEGEAVVGVEVPGFGDLVGVALVMKQQFGGGLGVVEDDAAGGGGGGIDVGVERVVGGMEVVGGGFDGEFEGKGEGVADDILGGLWVGDGGAGVGADEVTFGDLLKVGAIGGFVELFEDGFAGGVPVGEVAGGVVALAAALDFIDAVAIDAGFFDPEVMEGVAGFLVVAAFYVDGVEGIAGFFDGGKYVGEEFVGGRLEDFGDGEEGGGGGEEFQGVGDGGVDADGCGSGGGLRGGWRCGCGGGGGDRAGEGEEERREERGGGEDDGAAGRGHGEQYRCLGRAAGKIFRGICGGGGFEGAGDGGEGGLGVHDVADVFVGGGGFFEQGAGEAGVVPDVGGFELGAEGGGGEFLAGLGAGEGAACAVGGGAEGGCVAFAGGVVGSGGHGAGDEPGLVEVGGGGAFAVDEEGLAGEEWVGFGLEVIVIDVEEGVEQGGDVEGLLEGACGGEGEGAAIGGGVLAGDLDVGEVGLAGGGVGVEGEEVCGGFVGVGEVVVVDELAEVAGAGVEHEPEAAGVVGLEFEEVVAGAEGAELEAGVFAVEGGGEVRVGEGLAAEFIGEGWGSLAVVAAGGAECLEGGEEAGGALRVGEEVGVGVEPEGEHAAADVAADGVGKEEGGGGDDGADAEFGGEVYVGHDGDVGDAGGLLEAREEVGDAWGEGGGGEEVQLGDGFNGFNWEVGGCHGRGSSVGGVGDRGRIWKESWGVRLRLMDWAMALRRRPVTSSRRGRRSAGEASGESRRTRRWPAWGAGRTASTRRDWSRGSAHSPARARERARWTCLQRAAVLWSGFSLREEGESNRGRRGPPIWGARRWPREG